MISFAIPTYEQVAEEARPAFDQFKASMGWMPNLYAGIGYSANGLNSYLQYVRAQAKNTFHAREREAIYLIVSQFNGCEYCLASHTQSAIKAGWKEEDTLALRAGTYAEPKWKVIYAVIRSIIEHKGEVSEELKGAFSELGYQEGALIDLLVLVNVMSFTNYAFRMMRVPIDFPLAKEIGG